MDDEPVHIVLLIAGPDGDNRRYLRILSRFTQVLRVAESRESIIRAETPEEILEVFRDRG
jgi:PTS system fructose-specific IIC component